MTKATMKRKTAKDVLNEYILNYQPKDEDLLEAFDVSRQRLWEYKNGFGKPSSERLGKMAKRADWVGDMAREMLALRGLQVSAPAATMVEAEGMA
jgi:transcriptional regulator with XRE-family HTH domain